MLKRINLRGILLILVLSFYVITFGFTRTEDRIAKNAYMVYLDGQKIGLIEDKDNLYDMIDAEQETIKLDFGVDKVYPPHVLAAI